MSLDLQPFKVYDVSSFPIVTACNDAIVDGYAARWEKELDALVTQPFPFVLIFSAGRPDHESHEDRKRRMIWFKANKDRLGSVCRVLISIEPDAQEREQARARSQDLIKMFGVPLETDHQLTHSFCGCGLSQASILGSPGPSAAACRWPQPNRDKTPSPRQA